MSEAVLDIQFTTTGADVAASKLDAVADKSVKAEVAADKLAAGNKRAGGAIAQMVASIERSLGQLVAMQRAQGAAAGAAHGLADATSHAVREQEALIRTSAKLNAAHGSAIASSKSMQQATLNLGRQFADVGTSLAGGMSPLMILAQQGPQITDIFSQLKTQGIGAGAAFSAMGAALAPALPLILGVGLAVGLAAGYFSVFEKAVDANTKHATTWGDTWNATIHVIGKRIKDGPIGDGLKWLGGAFAATMDFLVDRVTGFYDGTVGFFVATYQTVVKHWSNLPAALGAIMQGAVNKMLDGIEFLINGVIKGINYIREKAGLQALADIDLPRLHVANAKVAADFSSAWVAAAAAAKKAREGFAADVSAQADREYEKRQKDKAKATKGATDEIIKLDDSLVSVIEKEIRASDAIKGFNDNVKTMGDRLGDVRIPSALENMITALEQARDQSDAVARSVDDIFYGIKNNDWAGAFSGLLRTLDQVKIAFDKTATSQERLSAIAGVGMGIGSAVGGTAGAGISGAASGALAGGAFAGSKLGTAIMPGLGTIGGAVLGGLIGGISSLFGSSSAKKQAKAEEARRKAEQEAIRLAEEQARVMAIANEKRSLELELMQAQGRTFEALWAGRMAEIEAMDESNRALAMRVFHAQDDARTLELGIQLLEARGAAEEALYQRQQQTLAGLAESQQVVQKAIWAEQELTKAREAAAEHARAVAERQTTIQGQIDQLTLSSSDLLAKSRAAEMAEAVKLDASLGPLLKSLYDLQDAATATATANAHAAEVLGRQTTIQGQIDALTMTSAELLAKTRAAEVAEAQKLDAALAPLLQSLYGLQDAASAAAAAAEAASIAEQDYARAQERAAAIASERQSLELRLLDATGQSIEALAMRRQIERDSINEGNRAMLDAIFAAEDLAAANDNLSRAQEAATAAATQAAEVAAAAAKEQADIERAMAATGKGLLVELFVAMGRESEALAISREIELAAMEESLRPLKQLIWAEEDLKKARDAGVVSAKAAQDAAAELLNAQRNDAAALVDRARSDLTSAYQREQSEIQATIDKHRSMAQSLREYRSSLIPGATAGSATGYAVTKSEFERVSALARLGNEEALGQLQGVSEAFREESLKNAKTSLDYLSDLGRINEAVRQAEETSTRQASIADQQLAALNAQVQAELGTTQAVLTVADAIRALQSAIGVQNSTWGGEMANPGREWGVNASANQLLARTTGYAGDFGGGGFQSWIEGQSEATKAQARAILQAQGQAYRVAFADGGVFTSPTDFRMGSQLGQMAEAGPEAIMPLVQTAGGLGVRAVGAGNDDLKAEIRDLKETLNAALVAIAISTSRGARAGEKHLDLFDRVTDGGEAMQTTEAA